MQKDLNSNKHERPKLELNTFEFEIFDEWLKKWTKIMMIDDRGSVEWKTFFVQNIDYLIDPAKPIKNDRILYDFMDN